LPTVNLILPGHMPAERRKAISDGVHDALISEFGIHPKGRFHMVTPYDGANLIMDPAFLGIPRGPDFTFIQIVAAQGEGDDRKRALTRNIRANLAASGDLKPEDLLVSIIETPIQNWFCLVK
jgi:hypothetical protein